ncbi:MAG TPA: DUF5615 family PIN-like protein [Caulobacteraceae bacterium]
MAKPAVTVSFICDEMLAALARWLRAAGHDTLLASPGEKDDDVVARARREDRILLTRDRRLAERAAATARIVRLNADDLNGQACELRAALDLNWTVAPFTRCMIDNAQLVELDPARFDDLPVSARRLPGPFRRCPACGRHYWPGSHAKRISRRLESWTSCR